MLVNIKCPYCGSKDVIKYGKRASKQGKIKRYLCKNCNKAFSEKRLEYKTYNPRTILSAISIFNLGYTLAETNKLINKRFGIRVPEVTVYSWIKKYVGIV